jgi:hypothetical protein
MEKRLQLGGFSWNLTFVYLSKICPENSSSLKSDQGNGTLHDEDNYTFVSYLAQFLVEWEMFQIQAVEEIKTHISILLLLHRAFRWFNHFCTPTYALYMYIINN